MSLESANAIIGPATAFNVEKLSKSALLREFKRRWANEDIDEDDIGFVIEELLDDREARIADADALGEATARWKRGDRKEALHHLEIALGSDWYGLERATP